MRTTVSILIAIAIAAFVLGVSQGESSASSTMKMEGLGIFPVNDMTWKDGPPSLPKGAMIAVLEGEPSKEGPFTFRVKIPNGYRVPPHTHPKTERVTVISGTFNLGMGDKFEDSAGTAMPAGTYGYWPAGMHHFAWAEGETVVQFHGIGPWSIQYLNPADDPRNAAKSP